MSKDNQILAELLEAFGVSGNLFILWDENGSLITCDSQTGHLIKSLGSKKTKELNIDGFMTLLYENKQFDQNLCKQFLHNFKAVDTHSNFKKMLCELNLSPDLKHTEIQFSKTPTNNILTVFKDNSEYVSTKNSLKTLEQAISKAPIGLMIWDENDKLIIASEKTIKAGEDYDFKFTPGASRIEARKVVAKNVVKDDDLSDELWAENAQKEWSGLTGSQIRFRELKNGNVDLIEETRLPDGSGVVFNIDITELKKRETELARFKTSIDNSPIRIMMFDDEGQLILVNESMKEQLTKYNVSAQIGTKRDELRKGLLPNLDLKK